MLFRPKQPEQVIFQTQEFNIGEVTQAEPRDFTLSIKPLSRGLIELSEITIRFYPRFGVSGWQFSYQLESTHVARVYPNVLSHEQVEIKAFQRLNAGETPTHFRVGEGREFDSLRQYTHGDDLRKVDWKRSANGKGTLVKVYRPETHQRINIAIDCGRRMGSIVDQRLQIEHAADAASQLVRSAKGGDDEIGLFAFNHQVVGQLKSARGVRQEKKIAEELLKLKVGFLESDYDLLATWARSNRKRSLLVFITTLSNPASLEVIRNALWPVRNKHLPLVCAISDRDLNNLVKAPVETLEDSYIVSAGMEQIDKIQQRLQSLRRMGIESIYSDATRLPVALVQKYYQLKNTGRL